MALADNNLTMPALAIRPDNRGVLAFTVIGGRVTAITSVSNPVRLASMDLPDPPRWLSRPDRG